MSRVTLLVVDGLLVESVVHESDATHVYEVRRDGELIAEFRELAPLVEWLEHRSLPTTWN